MNRYELKLPKMGESVNEATIVKWFKSEGDVIEVDETILEVATDKVDNEVPCDYEGTLIKILQPEGAVVAVGAVLAIIETKKPLNSGEGVLRNGYIEQGPEVPFEESLKSMSPLTQEMDQLLESDPQKDLDLNDADQYYSPLVKSIITKEQIKGFELEKIPRTGLKGRFDEIRYIGLFDHTS